MVRFENEEGEKAIALLKQPKIPPSVVPPSIGLAAIEKCWIPLPVLDRQVGQTITEEMSQLIRNKLGMVLNRLIFSQRI